MLTSLWTGASGMNSQQLNIDTISNNLSNVNTSGFKKNRIDFQDLYYQTINTSGTPKTEEYTKPIGSQIGVGSKVVSTQKLFEQGSLKETNNLLDIALEGRGFFQLRDSNGEIVYSRDGSFNIDSNGQLLNQSGLKLIPEIFIDETIDKNTIGISLNGVVTAVDSDDNIINLGQILTVKFINPAGLESIGDNNFRETVASGGPLIGIPGENKFPNLRQGFLEMSNVKVVDELVNMITAQRAYEMNSKSIQTSDSMLETAIMLKR